MPKKRNYGYNRGMNDAKEEIRARLPIEDVVGQYIELKRAGRNLKGRSPWGVDKTPSFMVSPEKGIWHDFSANKGGDIFSFVMEVEGVEFREALEKLAAQAGVELKRYSGGDKKVAQRKARAREALEWASKFYQVCLTKNKTVCEYVFYKRNLNRGTVGEFRIGYAPVAGKILVKFLKKKGFTEKEMEEAGLLNQYGGDLFRGRMMVPFIERGGQVVGFTARILGKGEPKYLNTPETLLFNKSRFIFGLEQAKEAILKNGFVVIVEGNMDVISSHQAEVKEAVATSGTAMTEMHLKILSRLTPDIRLAYDGDVAGVKAAERAINMAGELGINLSVVADYQGAKDPDELIQRDPKLWQEAVQNKKPAIDWLLDKYEEKLDLTTGVGKREYSDLAMKLIGYIVDPVEKKHYEQLVAGRLDVSVEDLRAKRVEKGKVRRLKEVKVEPVRDKTLKTLEDNLLAIMLYGAVPAVKIDLKMPEEETRVAELSLVFEARYKNWTEEMLKKEAEELTRRWNQEVVKKKIAELTAKLPTGDEEKDRKILREITSLQKG